MSVYLDHAATTPMIPEAARVLAEQLARPGNPSSLHASGRAARRVVEESRERLAAALGARPSEVVWTSGGTEADNLAVKGLFWARRTQHPGRRRLLVSAVEHHAVLDPAFWMAEHAGAELVLLPVDADGVLEVDALRDELERHGEQAALISVMWANNEVGALQPLDDVVALGAPVRGARARRRGAGRGPGAGRLRCVRARRDDRHRAQGRRTGRRGCAAGPPRARPHARAARRRAGARGAVRHARRGAAGVVRARGRRRRRGARGVRRPASERCATRSSRASRRSCPDAVLRGPARHGSRRLPANAHFTFPGCEGDSLLYLLDSAGIEASTGSACQAGVPRPSHVLLAMGVDEVAARGALRFSLGHTSTADDVEALLAALPGVVDRARAAGLATVGAVS